MSWVSSDGCSSCDGPLSLRRGGELDVPVLVKAALIQEYVRKRHGVEAFVDVLG
jgi:hypothetical protein